MNPVVLAGICVSLGVAKLQLGTVALETGNETLGEQN